MLDRSCGLGDEAEMKCNSGAAMVPPRPLESCWGWFKGADRRAAIDAIRALFAAPLAILE